MPLPTPGESRSKISNAEADLLTEKKQVNEEKAQAAAMMADELLMAYAKENHKWLYEIYRMGGLSNADFNAKVRERMGTAAKPAETSLPQAAESAFEKLQRTADRKFKK